VAIGVGLIALAAVGGLVLLFTGGDDDSGPKTSQQVSQIQDKFLKHTVVQPDKGISVRRPANWKVSKNNGVVALHSRDNCLAMTFSAPQPAGQAKGLRDDSIALLKRSFSGAKTHAAPDSPVGGIPTTSDAISFTQKGHPIKVLLSVGTGDKYAYLTEIVVRDPRCQGDLQLAQVVLSSVQYTK
jgi:hypothetical protein